SPVDRVGHPGGQGERPRRRRPPRPKGGHPPSHQPHPQGAQGDQVGVAPGPSQRRPKGIGQPQVPRRQPPPRPRLLPELMRLPPPRLVRLEGPAVPAGRARQARPGEDDHTASTQPDPDPARPVHRPIRSVLVRPAPSRTQPAPVPPSTRPAPPPPLPPRPSPPA